MKKNVLLITVDCLRPDHLGCYGYWRKTSPNIDSLARGSFVFSDAISNGNSTPLAFPCILGSEYPQEGSNPLKFLSPKSTLISEHLKKEGYVTAAFHSNPLLNKACGYAKGFDLFEDFSSDFPAPSKMRKLKKRIVRHITKNPTLHQLIKGLQTYFLKAPYIPGEFLNKKVISWLNSVQTPFFLWVHYMDIHPPYLYSGEKPKSFSRLSKFQRGKLMGKVAYPDKISKRELQDIIDIYDTEVAYVDSQIGKLLRYLKKGGWSKDTIVILTADHGTELKEHGEFTHGEKLYDEILRVPLIIKLPKLYRKVPIKSLVSQLNIVPSILDLLGLPENRCYRGNSFLSELEEGNKNFVISEGCAPFNNKRNKRIYSYRSKRIKYILDPITKKQEAYNLVKDPQESNNLIGKIKVKPFKDKVEAHIRNKKSY